MGTDRLENALAIEATISVLASRVFASSTIWCPPDL
jgi:hypothetical protein